MADRPTLQGRWNAWDCPTCGAVLVSIDRDEGTTPFMLACRATGCMGSAQSRFYPKGDPPSEPEWEWYRPADGEAVPERMQEHVLMGGLLLRRIDGMEVPASPSDGDSSGFGLALATALGGFGRLMRGPFVAPAPLVPVRGFSRRQEPQRRRKGGRRR